MILSEKCKSELYVKFEIPPIIVQKQGLILFRAVLFPRPPLIPTLIMVENLFLAILSLLSPGPFIGPVEIGGKKIKKNISFLPPVYC
jgi:hypothetical protein